MNRKFYPLIMVFLLLAVQLDGQEKYPFSRQDSAKIAEYDSLSNLHQQQNQYKEQSRYLNNMAMLYWEHNHFTKARKYYEQSLALNKKVGNENGIAMINSNLAMINADEGKYEDAVGYFKRTLTARKVRGEKVGTISAMINLSVVLNNLERYQESLDYLHEALDLAREMNNPRQMKSCYGMLAETYEKAGNSEKSLYYFDYFRTFHDKIQKDKIREKEQEIANERLQRKLAEAEKRNKELELKQKDTVITRKNKQITDLGSAKQKLLDTLSRKQLELKYTGQMRELEQEQFARKQQEQREVRNYILAGTGFVFIVASLLFIGLTQYRRTARKLEAQKQQIESQSKDLEAQNKKLQELTNFKEGLMHMIVHDLKHPLNTILNNTEASADNKLYIAARQLERLTLNILDVTKYQNSQLEVHPKPLDFSSIMQDALEQVSPYIREQYLEFDSNNQAVTVAGDHDTLVRVLVNLLSNASKYVNKGGTIRITTLRRNGQGLVGLYNSGHHIPRDKQDSIFNQFQQLEARDSGKIKSTGLGLTFCKMAVEGHNGKIWVDSAPQQGTTFWFTIPLAKEQTQSTAMPAGKKATSDFPKEELQQYRNELQQYDYFEISAIRSVLKRIPPDASENAQEWKKQINRAVLNGDEQTYNALIQ